MKSGGLKREMVEGFARVDQRLDETNRRVGALELRFDGLERPFDTLEQRFDTLERRFDTLELRFDTLEQRFDVLEQRFGGLERRFETLERRVLQDGETTRRHFDVIAEQWRADLRLSLDRALATSTQMAILDAVNKAEHAGFSRMVDDHESRLATLPKS